MTVYGVCVYRKNFDINGANKLIEWLRDLNSFFFWLHKYKIHAKRYVGVLGKRTRMNIQ